MIRHRPFSPIASGIPPSRRSSTGKSTPASPKTADPTASASTWAELSASVMHERRAAAAAAIPTLSQSEESSLAPRPSSAPELSVSTAWVCAPSPSTPSTRPIRARYDS